MGIFQTTFGTVPGVGFPGMRANTEPENVISRTVESAAGLAWGQPAFRGSDDHGCIIGGTYAATSVGAAVAGNTGAETITAAPPVVSPAKQGVYLLTAVSAGATAVFLMTDPDGVPMGEVTTGTPATIGGIGPFTITDAGTDPAIGDQMSITVTYTANAVLLGFAVAATGSVPALAATPDAYPQYAGAAIMNEGVLWVTAGAGGVVDGAQAYWNPATLKYTAATGILLPGVVYDTTAAADALTRLAIRKRIGIGT